MHNELPNIVSLIAERFHGTAFAESLLLWENIIYSAAVGIVIAAVACASSRRLALVPGKLQNVAEVVVGGVDDFVCGILGPKGRKFTPFIGTLFVYILCMNLLGLIPLMKSPTSSWSVTFALAICVFVYVHYTAFRELGFWGYFDHLAGSPRGGIAWSIILPVFMFVLHLIGELIRPMSLSLRLRSNIWGEDMLLMVLAGFGLKGAPLLIFGMTLSLIGAVVQAAVFVILTTIYFALVIKHEEQK